VQLANHDPNKPPTTAPKGKTKGCLLKMEMELRPSWKPHQMERREVLTAINK
jgi:hypothetical protein